MIVPSLKGFLFAKANQMNKEDGDLIWENNVFVWPRTNRNAGSASGSASGWRRRHFRLEESNGESNGESRKVCRSLFVSLRLDVSFASFVTFQIFFDRGAISAAGTPQREVACGKAKCRCPKCSGFKRTWFNSRNHFVLLIALNLFLQASPANSPASSFRCWMSGTHHNSLWWQSKLIKWRLFAQKAA